MESSDSGTTPAQGATATAPVTTAVTDEATRPRSRRQIWMIALLAGVLAGLLAWLIGESTHGFFRPRLYPVSAMGMTAMRPSRESQQLADTMNARLAFAILGGSTGLIMGLAGGLAGRSPARGVMAGLAGTVFGAAVAVLASMAFLPFFFQSLVPDTNELLTPILIHGGIWMAIGAIGGLAFNVGMSRGRHLLSTVGAACSGAFVAAVFYHLLGGLLILDSSAAEPLASSALLRLLAMLLVAVLVAVGAARGALGRVLAKTSSASAH
jgi:hypothetical protein